MRLLIAAMTFMLATGVASKQRTVHYDNPTAKSCQLTHKATPQENWIGVDCQYACYRPLVEGMDAKDGSETILCREEIKQ